MPEFVPLAVFLAAVGIALFGLFRLSVARRGTDADWQALVAFARRLPEVAPWIPNDPARWAEALAHAPAGVLADGSGEPLTAQTAHDRVRLHQATLQSEMKWYTRRLTNPLEWFQAGLRGCVLAPLGLAVDVDAATRAKRRRLEAHPDFQRTVTAVSAVVLFVLLVAGWFGFRQGITAWRRFTLG